MNDNKGGFFFLLRAAFFQFNFPLHMGGLRTLITFAALVNVFVLSWWMTRGSISVTIQGCFA